MQRKFKFPIRLSGPKCFALFCFRKGRRSVEGSIWLCTLSFYINNVNVVEALSSIFPRQPQKLLFNWMTGLNLWLRWQKCYVKSHKDNSEDGRLQGKQKYFLCCHLFMTKLCSDMQIFLSSKGNFKYLSLMHYSSVERRIRRRSEALCRRFRHLIIPSLTKKQWDDKRRFRWVKTKTYD